MPKFSHILGLLLLVAASFFAGTLFIGSHAAKTASSEGQILRYICPMHPEFTSDKPGDAPCCGMRLEPVYADADSQGITDRIHPGSPMPAGAVRISGEKQQLIGVQLATVQQEPETRTIRLPGRVSADERRIYFLVAATDGWIRDTFSNTTGGLVGKDEILATYYAPEFQGAEQAYFYALNAMDRYRATGKESPDQITLTTLNIQQAVDGLRNLGMSDIQIQQLEKSRLITRTIELRSPAHGFVLERNVSPGLRFERGTRLYRIADLSRVWVLADIYQNDSRYFKPGERVRVSLPLQQKTFPATVSDVLPQFDPVTRTLKLRLECNNPGYALRPDMFVDVELPVNLEQATIIPADSVVHSGLRKTVFVARSDGLFEPRNVETGRRYGDRVEIIAGLTPGERIVVSGAFLVDSESRLKSAAMETQSTGYQDPVCGMRVDEARARAAGTTAVYGGATHYFCSQKCKQLFEKETLRYVKDTAGGRAMTKVDGFSTAIDPVCGMDVDKKEAVESGKVAEFAGKKHYFCAESCLESFKKNPALYAGKRTPSPENYGSSRMLGRVGNQDPHQDIDDELRAGQNAGEYGKQPND